MEDDHEGESSSLVVYYLFPRKKKKRKNVGMGGLRLARGQSRPSVRARGFKTHAGEHDQLQQSFAGLDISFPGVYFRGIVSRLLAGQNHESYVTVVRALRDFSAPYRLFTGNFTSVGSGFY